MIVDIFLKLLRLAELANHHTELTLLAVLLLQNPLNLLLAAWLRAFNQHIVANFVMLHDFTHSELRLAKLAGDFVERTLQLMLGNFFLGKLLVAPLVTAQDYAEGTVLKVVLVVAVA